VTEHDTILSRLRGLASVPVDDAVAERHLSQLAVVEAAPSGSGRRGRTLLVGAVMAGTMVSGATLAGAATGRLPDRAQDAAHGALAKVGIEVPKGKAGGPDAKGDDTGGPGRVERFLGDATTACTLPDGSPFVGNHGQYVQAHEDDPATPDVNEREEAAKSPCGKPVQAVGEDAGGVEGDAGKPDGAGRPESPGKAADHKPAGTGKPDDSGREVKTEEVETDEVETEEVETEEVETDDGTDNSGKDGSGNDRNGEAPKVPDRDTSTKG
jgi:hypothetical protein